MKKGVNGSVSFSVSNLLSQGTPSLVLPYPLPLPWWALSIGHFHDTSWEICRVAPLSRLLRRWPLISSSYSFWYPWCRQTFGYRKAGIVGYDVSVREVEVMRRNRAIYQHTTFINNVKWRRSCLTLCSSIIFRNFMLPGCRLKQEPRPDKTSFCVACIIKSLWGIDGTRDRGVHTDAGLLWHESLVALWWYVQLSIKVSHYRNHDNCFHFQIGHWTESEKKSLIVGCSLATPTWLVGGNLADREVQAMKTKCSVFLLRKNVQV